MKKLLSTALILSAAAFAGTAHAQSRQWASSPVSTEWTDDRNWTTGGVPGAGDTAYIARHHAVISSTVPNVNGVYVGGAALSELTIGTGGNLTVIGNGLTRIGNTANTIGRLTIAGGTLNATGRVYLGVNKGIEATLVISHGGTLNTNNVLGLSNQTDSDSNQTATVVIGGLTTAAEAGWINATGISGGGTVNQNTIIFNHTNARYTLLKGATSTEALNIQNLVKVQLKAGTTVLTGNNTYTQGTVINSGAALLANTTAASQSSTGTGAVTVDLGGTLGGIGYIGGATTVSGTLKPGDYAFGATTASYEVLKFKDDLTLLGGSTTEFTLNGLSRGVDYSAINVAGDLALNGTLKIVLGSDFVLTPDRDEAFQLFNVTGDITGTYATLDLPDTWEGFSLLWNTDNLATTGNLSVHVQPIPEPSHIITALGVGLALLLLRRRSAASLPV